MKHIWTDNLRAFAYLAGCALHPFFPRRYFAQTVSGPTKRLIALMERVGWTPPGVEPVIVRLAAKDSSGVNIRARMEELKAVIARDIVGDDATAFGLPSELRPYASEWLRILTLLVNQMNTPLVYFLATMENAYATGQVRAENVRKICFHHSCRTGLRVSARACAKQVRAPVKVAFSFYRSAADWRKIVSVVVWLTSAGFLHLFSAMRHRRECPDLFRTSLPAEGGGWRDGARAI